VQLLLAGENWSYLEKNLPGGILSTTNVTWSAMGLNPGFCSRNPVINHCICQCIVLNYLSKIWWRWHKEKSCDLWKIFQDFGNEHTSYWRTILYKTNTNMVIGKTYAVDAGITFLRNIMIKNSQGKYCRNKD